MADIVSLATAAPAVAPIAGLFVPGDAAPPASSMLEGDPFAAFLATAQAKPTVVSAPTAAIVAPDRQTAIMADGALPVADIDPTPPDGEPVDSPDASTPAQTVDPSLTPALAMLSALVTTEPGTSRAPIARPNPQPRISVNSAAKTLVDIVPQTVPSAARSTPSLMATATSGAIPATAVSATTPAAATAPVPATTPPAAMTPTPATVAVIATVAAPATPSVSTESVVPAAPVVRAGEINPQPVASQQPAPRAPASAKPSPTPNNAVETPPASAIEAAVVADASDQVEVRAAPPAKARAPRPLMPRSDAVDPAPTSERSARVPAAPSAPRLSAEVARDPTRAEPIVAPSPLVTSERAPAGSVAQTPAADLLVQRQLTIADDGRWLDGLARDIAQSASGGTLQFRLEPVNLGSLTVAIAQGSDGTAIRMTAETHHARDLLVDAQPALIAEARANGLRISETHVDLSSANRDNGGSNPPPGGQPSFANGSTGQQAMRQDSNARRQPDMPAPLPSQPRSAKADAPTRDSGERFA